MFIMKLENENDERDRTTKWGKIRTLREKENYKYLEILGEYTFKQAGMKEKIKRTPQENETNHSKRSYIEETLWER